MLNNLSILFCGFQIDYISIHCFHHVVTAPSSALQYVLVGDADSVHNTGRVMSEIMEAEVRNAREAHGPAEAAGDLLGGGLDNEFVKVFL